MKKVLFFGPLEDFGGRELETAFIAHIISKKYIVDICSSTSFTMKSQIYNFDKKQHAFSLNSLLIENYLSIKLFASISYWKNRSNKNRSFFAKNYISKHYLDYKKKIKEQLELLIPKYDLIFICSQLSSNYIDDIVKITNSNNIKVILRTTGTINYIKYSYLKNIDCFVHHSNSNASKLILKSNFEIIDQCAFNETDLLKVQISKNEIKNFLVLSRLSPEKGIEQAIEYFLKCNDKTSKLYIAGSGELENYLKNTYKDQTAIVFLGFIDSNNFQDLFNKIDCLIIPSCEESGPLVGIEAMCAGKIIISTRVGAMSERLNKTLNNFWYDFNNFNSFEKTFVKVKSLKTNEIEIISKNLRTHYLENYALKIIENKYLNLIEKNLN